MRKALPGLWILCICLTTCGRPGANSAVRDQLIGEWYSGEGTKFNYSGNRVVSIQPLAAGHTLLTYQEDGQFRHASRDGTEQFELIEGNKKILYSAGTEKERFYDIMKISSDSLVVYGPFTRNGKKYDPSALYILRHYRR